MDDIGTKQFTYVIHIYVPLYQADVSLEESQRGLLLQPTELPVTVEDSPINAGLVFTQFTGTLSGTITCIGKPHYRFV